MAGEIIIRKPRDETESAGFEEEMKAFSWWFASKKFDDSWSVEQLLQTLRIVRGVDADMLVVERLAELCPRFSLQVMECLTLIVEGDEEGLGILGWKGEARSALAAAVASGDEEATHARHSFSQGAIPQSGCILLRSLYSATFLDFDRRKPRNDFRWKRQLCAIARRRR